jgi:hypothetical protein
MKYSTSPFYRLFFLSAALLLVQPGRAQSDKKGKNHELVFLSVNVIPMDRETILPNQNVVVQNGIITYIGNDKKVRWRKNATVVDGRGKYLMPGLAEMHAHVPPVADITPMKEVLTLFLANGVTTIRGMLGHPKHLELKAKIKSGEILGPEFHTSGPSANVNSVPTSEAAIQLVKEQKAAGYDFIKIHPGIKMQAFETLAKSAKQENMPFAGHVPADVGIWDAIDLGIHTIDHLDGMIEALMPGKEKFMEGAHGLFASHSFLQADTNRISQLMQALLRQKVWIVPTQALAVRWLSPAASAADRSREPEMRYMDKRTIENWIIAKNNMEAQPGYQRSNMPQYISLRNQLIRACQQNGVPLLLGSDAPQVFNVPGFSVHHELQYLVDAGLTPYQALYSSTVNVGKFLGDKNKGTIQRNAAADLILLSANPLDKIENTKTIKGIFIDGHWLDKEWIESNLKQIAASKTGQ